MNTVCTDDLTIGQVKELAKIVGGMGGVTEMEHPYHIGKNYFIRTVTFYYIGTLRRVTQQELVLEDAVWVADTGRFHQAMTDGTLSEIEPFGKGEVIIGRGAVIDATLWNHMVPTTQK